MSLRERVTLILFGLAVLVVIWVVGQHFGVTEALILSAIAYLLLIKGAMW